MSENYNIELPEFKVLSKEVTEDDDFVYTIELKEKLTVCPHCGSKLHLHKTTERKVQDLPQFGHRVGLIIKSRRYRCSNSECKSNIGEEYPSIYSTGKMTIRLREYLKTESFFKTFKELADEYSLSVQSVRELFDEKAEELKKNHQIITPEVLGIDEIHLKKIYCGVFVDIKGERVIELTEKRDKKTVINFLKSLPEKDKIKCVTMDMWRPYKDAVHAVLPGVPVVVDRFHVIKELNVCLDKIRSETTKKLKEKKERASLKGNRFLLLASQENLQSWQIEKLQDLIDEFPEFIDPYILKEAFRSIYECETRQEAEAAFLEWIQDCKDKQITGYDTFISTVWNWHTEIFNYFDYRYTNAETESLNNTIRDLDREGRGYSFEVLRNKVVLKYQLKSAKSKGKFKF